MWAVEAWSLPLVQGMRTEGRTSPAEGGQQGRVLRSEQEAGQGTESLRRGSVSGLGENSHSSGQANRDQPRTPLSTGSAGHHCRNATL